MLQFQVGDITRMQADVLVNAANGMGPMGGGVAGALRRAGGREIEDEAVRVCRRLDPHPGEVYVTGAGRLAARHVFHAVTMKNPAQSSGIEIVEECLYSLLQKAREYGVHTLAIPALATGVGGVPPQDVAGVYARVLGSVSDLEITVVDVNRRFIDLLEEALGNRKSEGSPG